MKWEAYNDQDHISIRIDTPTFVNKLIADSCRFNAGWSAILWSIVG